MKLKVNGETRELADGTTVGGLLEELGLADAVCAVELNRSILPRAERAERKLVEGDSIEIVTLVGGG